MFNMVKVGFALSPPEVIKHLTASCWLGERERLVAISMCSKWQSCDGGDHLFSVYDLGDGAYGKSIDFKGASD